MNTNNTLSSKEIEGLPLDLLTNYIVEAHHRYVNNSIPVLTAMLRKITTNEIERFPGLVRINDLVRQVSNDLIPHMQKEEMVLFPLIRKLVAAENLGTTELEREYKGISSPVSVIRMEHQTSKIMLEQLHRLTNNFKLADEDGGLQEYFFKLKEFANDLHRHIYLEDEVLISRIIALRKTIEMA